jgi:hypothetical protein
MLEVEALAVQQPAVAAITAHLRHDEILLNAGAQRLVEYIRQMIVDAPQYLREGEDGGRP